MDAIPEEGNEHLLLLAREATARRDWITARELFRRAQAEGPLPAQDLYALSDAAWWLGMVDEALEVAGEAYRQFVEIGEPRKAAMAAFGAAYTLSLRGDEAMASGWMGRGMRLLEQEPDAVEHGYVVYLELEAALAESDCERAVTKAREVRERGRRFQDPALMALAASGEGRALIQAGHVKEGIALLDEAMLAAVGEELDPGWAGNIYCHMMAACHDLMDVGRAAEWTEATARWCTSMPGAGPFMGICRVHRVQVLETWGAWDEGERECLRVRQDMANFHVSIVAEAEYELGQIRRLRGDWEGAEAAFRRAQQLGRDPQPGLALLRLEQGRAEAATAAIRSALAKEARNVLARARLRIAEVEIALGSRDLNAAEQATLELEATAAVYGTSGLRAAAKTARGALLVERAEFADALAALREALRCWQDIAAPYEGARVRCLLSRAHAGLGDWDTASSELQAATRALESLGARPPGRRVLEHGSSLAGGLTEREHEVLTLATLGLSNGEIAAELVLSVRTVERHLATIYQKLGVRGRNARAAAVSLAFRGGVRRA